MSRRTRILGYVQSQNTKAGELPASLIGLLRASLKDNSIPGVIDAGLKDGCIGLDTSEEASYEVNAGNHNFAERLARVISQPELKGLNFIGEFTLVTDGYPLPIILHVGVRGTEVFASQGNIQWGEMVSIGS